MDLDLRAAVRRIGWLLPGVRVERRLRKLQGSVQELQDMVQRLQHFSLGTSATYMGNNRVLVRVIAGRHLFNMFVHADDKLISPSFIVNGRYEPELTDFFVKELKPDSHCIDVGANIGYFSCLMAKFSPQGRVIGLEPNRLVHATAVDNILLNALHDQARILNVAASDQIGEITLFHRVGRAGNTSMAACGEDFTRAFQEPPEEAFQVPTVRIDDLLDQLSSRVDFLKIDVEGAEPLAFAGAGKVIAGNPQLQIVMEWAPGQIRHAGFDIAEFVRDIAAAGLRPFLLAASPPRAISHAELVDLPYQPGVLLRRDTA